MKDSGVEWIGEIPEDWKVAKLKYLCNIYGRIGFRGYTQDDIVSEGEGAITLSPSNIQSGKGNYNKCTYLSWNKYHESPEIQVENGDILFVKTGSTYGKSCIVMDLPMEATINPQIVVVKDIQINNKYLSYILYSQIVENQVETSVVGGTIPTIAQEKIKNYVIIIPDNDSQKNIVSYLDKKCAEIDSLAEKTRESIEEYKKLKQAVITEAVTKGVRGKREMKDSGVEWIGEMPREWICIKAKYCVTITHGSDPHTEGDIPVYGSGSESFKTCGEFKEGPTVLVGRKGATLHIPHYINGRYWNVDTAFDVKSKSNYRLRFYYYCACSFDYKYYISQTTLPGMTQANYNNIFLPKPNVVEQQEIADYLDKKTAEIDKLIAKKEAMLEELDTYKKSLIYEYVTGKKQVIDA